MVHAPARVSYRRSASRNRAAQRLPPRARSPGPNDVRLSKFLDGAMELQPLRFKVDAASGRNDVTRMKGWRPDYRDYRGFPYVPERMGSPLRNEVHRT